MTRLASVIAEIVPAAEALPPRRSGSETHFPLRLIAGADWALYDLRSRLERPAVVSVGATLLREWPAAKVGHQVWRVSVRQDRAGLLADALKSRTVYPLALCSMTLGRLRAVAPDAEIDVEIEAQATTTRLHGRNLDSAYVVLVDQGALHLIEDGLERSRREDRKNEFWKVGEMSVYGAVDEKLGEALRQARLHPLERAS